MKCKNCGKEIADDSKFCEFCGTKIEKEIIGYSLNKRILFCSLLLIMILAILLVIFHKSPDFSTDRELMNLKGNVVRIIEKSLYVSPDESLGDHDTDIFDNAAFLSLVYGYEHMALYVNYKKWFISQVSDCEIQFDEYGNIKLLKSINDGGSIVNYLYDNSHCLIKTDLGSEFLGVIDYSYIKGRKGRVLEEKLHHRYEGIIWDNNEMKDTLFDNTYTISYLYKGKNIKQATMKMKDSYGEDCQGVFDYKGKKVVGIRLKDFWKTRGSGDHFIKIEYNSHGDISTVTSTGKKGDGTFITNFSYQYDSSGNWISRDGKMKDETGWECSILSTRDYIYQ